jgi:hypothetical protein
MTPEQRAIFKTCPCGTNPKVAKDGLLTNGNNYIAYCEKCKRRIGSFDTEQQAIEAWNLMLEKEIAK